MDTQTNLDLAIHHAHILAGSVQQTVPCAHRLIQQKVCAQGGCGHCLQCTHVVQHQHANLLWIDPEGAYTRQTLEPLFAAISFVREEQETFFCVLNHTDRMSAACYNSVLKSLEEPPRGYCFVLLSERADAIAPTIRSRCIQTQVGASNPSELTHPLAQFFTDTQYNKPVEFANLLEEHAPDEHETVALVDALLAYWMGQYKQTVAATPKDAAALKKIENVINILKDALQNPPPAGSSQLFWKCLFVRMKHSFF